MAIQWGGTVGSKWPLRHIAEPEMNGYSGTYATFTCSPVPPTKGDICMILTLNRRAVLAGVATLAATHTLAANQAAVFYRNPGCGCCEAWSKLMAEAGMLVEMRDSDDLNAFQEERNIPADLRGCHAGMIDSYAISGHVPPADIKRLLAEKPDAVGLAVPGMPTGSPGMEGSGQDPFEVVLFHKDGTREIFARYA
jgi:hypothetical protein